MFPPVPGTCYPMSVTVGARGVDGKEDEIKRLLRESTERARARQLSGNDVDDIDGDVPQNDTFETLSDRAAPAGPVYLH